VRRWFIMSSFICACAPDLRVDHPFDGQTTSGPLVSAVVLGSSTFLKVDATSKSAWVYVDLDESQELKVDEAFATNAWDLAFKRFEIKMNGGSQSSSGVVAVAVFKNQPFEETLKAPAQGYLQDGADSVFAKEADGWYVYDLTGSHGLTPRPVLYIVKSSQGAYFKLRMLDYYDEFGTAAALSLEIGRVLAP
jgi:hypothetical protein